MKIELKIKRWGKQNHNFDLEATLHEVAILKSMLEIEPALAKFTVNKFDFSPILVILFFRVKLSTSPSDLGLINISLLLPTNPLPSPSHIFPLS